MYITLISVTNCNMLCHQHPTSNKYLDMEDPRRAGMIVVVLLVFVVV